MRGSPSQYIESRCRTGLWEAMHDAKLLRVRVVGGGRKVSILLKSDIPYPPKRSASRMGLEFTGVQNFTLLRWEPPTDEKPMGDLARQDWATRGHYIPFTPKELADALREDPEAYVSEAGIDGSPPKTLAMYVVFGNLPLVVVVAVDADEIRVTANGRPSSFEEWMTLGTAGWNKFGRESLIRRIQLKLKGFFSSGRRS